MSHFNQPYMERKNCVTKYGRLSEMCIVQHVEMKSVFTFQVFKDQKPTIMLFGGDGTHCFARKTSRDYERPSPFLKKFLRQSQPSTSEREPKKDKSSPNME